MPLSLFSMSKTVPLHDDGAIVPGGLLYFYATGTTTPKDTYSDAGGLIPNMNPVVLDGAGRADIFLADDAGYDVVFTDPDNVTIWSLTNVVSASGASTGMGTAPSANTITTSGVQSALPTPIGRGDLVLYVNNGTTLTIRGIDAGYDGQSLFIHALGLGRIDLEHDSPSAAEEDSILNPFAGTISLAPRFGSAQLIYDATTARWRVFAHNQGDWLDYPTAWIGSGGGVASIADGTLRGQYYIDGRGMSFQIALGWGNTTAGPNAGWRFSLPDILDVIILNTPAVVQVHSGAGDVVGVAELTIFHGGTEGPWATPYVNGAVLGPTAPVAWTVGNSMQIAGIISLG